MNLPAGLTRDEVIGILANEVCLGVAGSDEILPALRQYNIKLNDFWEYLRIHFIN